jgi:hypothetical protein
MKAIIWNENKNKLLKKQRKISFEIVKKYIEKSLVLDIKIILVLIILIRKYL